MGKDSSDSNDKSQDKKYWVGFDLGGTKMLACVFDEDFKSIGRERKKTKGHLGAEVGLKRIAEGIGEALEDAGITTKQIAGIGIGCPGPLDPDSGILINAPNLGWKGVPICKFLEKEFGCPVVLSNDVDAGVYGEYRFGAGKGARCVIGLFPGTGIGGGCVYEGKILRGKNITCMEIGHMPVLHGGPFSGAGHAGSLEAVASRLSIASQSAQASYRGQAPALRKIAGTELSDIRSGVIAKAIHEGDEFVEKIVRQAARNIGTTMAGIIHLLAPDRIILGGGLVEAMPQIFETAVDEAINEWLLPAYHDCYRISVAKLGDDAGVMGAAAWAKDSLTGHSMDLESASSTESEGSEDDVSPVDGDDSNPADEQTKEE